MAVDKFDDLRGFISLVEKAGELKRVDGAHWNLEIGAITAFVAERKGPAVLFDKIPGYPEGFRVFSNPFASVKRTALAMGISTDLSPIATLDAWRQKMRQYKGVPPVEVKDGPVKQNVLTGDDVDLFKFPTPKWHELDGGRYLGTGCSVITRDPEEGWVNLGTYRGMIHDRNHIGVKLNKGKHGRLMMEKYHERGESCPIAIAIGQDPTLYLAASTMHTPWGVSEYDFTGWVKGTPVEVVKGVTTDLPIPATAEIVIEGEIPPLNKLEPRREGPFGEWVGYYVDTTTGVVPVMEVKSILYRDNPIILGAPPLRPPAPYHLGIPWQAAQIWNALEDADIPGIKGVWIMVAHGPLWLVISVKQRYAGHAKQAALVATGCRAGAFAGKFVVTVDDDIDITNTDEVLWAMATRCDVANMDIVRGVWTTPAEPTLDHDKRKAEENISTRALIDACWPYQRLKQAPPSIAPGSHYKEMIAKKFPQLME